MKDTVSGDLLPRGRPQRPDRLDSYEAAFYDLHGAHTSFRLEFLRGLVVHKMDLSLN